MEGPASKVVAAYADSLREESSASSSSSKALASTSTSALDSSLLVATGSGAQAEAGQIPVSGVARITQIEVMVDGQTGRELEAISLQSDVSITVKFESDPAQPCPTFATGFALPDGQIFTSAYTMFDGIRIERDAAGKGQALGSYRSRMMQLSMEEHLKTAVEAMFYDRSETNFNQITGIATHYSSLSDNSKDNIIK
jgi:hypothetical protein